MHQTQGGKLVQGLGSALFTPKYPRPFKPQLYSTSQTPQPKGQIFMKTSKAYFAMGSRPQTPKYTNFMSPTHSSSLKQNRRSRSGTNGVRTPKQQRQEVQIGNFFGNKKERRGKDPEIYSYKNVKIAPGTLNFNESRTKNFISKLSSEIRSTSKTLHNLEVTYG